MNSTEIKLVFTATFKVSGDNAIENAIERARAEYGNEVADYGVFTIKGEEEDE
jgi:flavin-binding protein dodecin